MLVSSNQLFRNSNRPDTYIRVLAVLPGGRKLYLFDIEQKNALPKAMDMADFIELVDAGELEPCPEEPHSLLVKANSSLTKAEIRTRDLRYDRIRELVTDFEHIILDADLRHVILSQVSVRTKTGRNHLYAWLRLWWRHGQLPNALAPRFDRCGGIGKPKLAGKSKRGRPPIIAGTGRGAGINVTADVAAKLQAGAGSLKKGRSWKQAFDDNALLHFRSEKLLNGRRVVLPPDERPTIQQFKYYVRKVLSSADVERATRGDAWFERNRAERTGFTRDAPSGPGAIFQIDATVANIWLRSRIDPSRFVGRPVLYLVTDQSSGLITGFTVSLSPASWEVAKLALENAFTDKVLSCKAQGIEISQDMWPCHHVPKQLTGDRHWDVLGANPGNAGLGLKINIANLPPYRPDLKSLVEGRFEWLDASSVKWAPGATHGRNRGDPDDRPHKLDGHYDLDAFRKFMILAICKHNLTLRIASPPTWYAMVKGGTPTPIEVWNYGCGHCGMPQFHEPSIIRANLLPVAKAKATDAGLKVHRLFYAPVDREKRQRFDRIRGRKWEFVEVRYDPRDVSSILVPDNSGGFDTFRLTPKDRRYDGWTMEEVDEVFARRRAVDSLAEAARMDHEVWFREQVKAIEVNARETAATARGLSAPPPKPRRKIRLAGDKELRRQEEQARRSEEAWTSVSARQVKAPPAAIRPVVVAAECEPTLTSECGKGPDSSRTLKPNKIDMLNRAAVEAVDKGEKI